MVVAEQRLEAQGSRPYSLLEKGGNKDKGGM